MGNYDELDNTTQRVYKYLKERLKNAPEYVNYSEIGEEVGRTRSAVSYAIKKLIKAGKIAIIDDKITLCVNIKNYCL